MICRELNLAALQPLFAAPHGRPSNPGSETIINCAPPPHARGERGASLAA
jgi:hypothetical protein